MIESYTLWYIKNPILISWQSWFEDKLAWFEVCARVCSHSNSIAASAVCAFNLSAITQAFSGPFRFQENPRMSWLSTPNPIPNFQVGNTPPPEICYYPFIYSLLQKNTIPKCCFYNTFLP